MLQNIGFTTDLQNQLNDFINSHSLCILMEMGYLLFSNMHVKKENMNAVLVPSFCHPVIKANLFSFMRFQTCNDDLGVLSDALSELGLIRQIKVFLMHSQTEDVNNEIVHILMLLKMYICMSNL